MAESFVKAWLYGQGRHCIILGQVFVSTPVDVISNICKISQLLCESVPESGR